MTNDKYQYWASVPPKEIADRILSKVDDYYEFLSTSGRMALYTRSWSYYYRPRVTGASLGVAGSQGELTTLSVNHYHNLLLHLETLTTQQRPAFEPRATNTDVKSQTQTILAAGLLDYYMREKHMERNIQLAAKDSLIFAEGFVRVDWDATAGEKHGITDTGAPVYNGDIKFQNYNPLDVVRDFTKTQANQDTWFILRDFLNKFDLAAKYPEISRQILEDDDDSLNEYYARSILNSTTLKDSCDNISVFTLIHKPTPAMPQGRYTQVLANGTVLIDGPIPFNETHVYRIAPDEETGTPFGYSIAFDLLPIQEMLDISYSTVATNQATNGVGNILMPIGSSIQASSMVDGLNIINFDPKIGKPEVLNLTATPPEVLKFIEMLEQVQQTISGINSVTRGNPEASLKSGSALALVQSMSIQFSMNFQRSYAQLIEDLGTGTIKILQQFAAAPRVAAIAGRSQRTLMMEFTGKDIDQINRVMVDMGNPLTRTTAGRVNLADGLFEKGLIKNTNQYLSVLNTGRLEPAIEGAQAELLLIRAENEKLSNGEAQLAIITDNHAEHILEHKAVLASPEARMDPVIVKNTLEHIQQHLDLARQADPAMMQILGQPVLPPPMPQIPMAPMMEAVPNAVQQAQDIAQPSMPNPPEGTDATSAAIIDGMKE